MNYLFYTNRHGYPYSSPSYFPRQVPVVPITSKTTPSDKKIVMIPVLDGSERKSLPQLSRLDSAVKIQKVFRGFLVRKSVKKIYEIKREVNEIENMFLIKENIEVIKNDDKERLKVNEMLMRLLLRLDSVRGVDSGVRDFRKAVIKKAIRLQELLDSIVNDFNSDSNMNSDAVSEKLDLVAATGAEGLSEEIRENVVNKEESLSECEESMDSTVNPQSLIRSYTEIEEEEEEDEVEQAGGGGDEKEREVRVECCLCGEGKDAEEEVAVSGNTNNDNRSREMLDKMMEDNKKMMGLMTQLFERNEMQTMLLNSLSHRVEQLERSLMCEKSKRKKKRNSALVADCLESTHDSKKSGKR